MFQSHHLNSAPYPFEFCTAPRRTQTGIWYSAKPLLYTFFLYAAHIANQLVQLILIFPACLDVTEYSVFLAMNHFGELNLITQNNPNKFHFRLKI
jgi:hypothetical protein